MKKNQFVFLLLIIAAFQAMAQEEIKIIFKSNPVHGLYIFAQGVSVGQGASPTFQELLAASPHGASEDVNKAIQLLQSVNTFYDYELEGYPEYRFNYVQLGQLITKAAAKAKDLEDFSTSIYGLLSPVDHESLFMALRILEPVYQEIIWKPNEQRLQEKMLAYSAAAEEHKFAQYFKKARNFYGSAWDYNVPFTVLLHPIFPYKGSLYLSATPQQSYITVATNVEQSAVEDDLETIFHELAHVLYDFQPKSVQQKLEKAYLNSKNPFRYKAYAAIDEGLATALGQGYFSKIIHGELSTRDWYAVPEINAYARALYPEVENYLNKSKPMDEAFVEKAIAIYAQVFPDALTRLATLMPDVSLLYDSELFPDQYLFQHFFTNFKMRSINELSPSTSMQNIAEFKKDIQTRILIVPVNHPEKLKSLTQSFPWLKANKNFEANNLVINYQEDIPYFAFFLKDVNDFGEGLKFLSSMEKIERGKIESWTW